MVPLFFLFQIFMTLDYSVLLYLLEWAQFFNLVLVVDNRQKICMNGQKTVDVD